MLDQKTKESIKKFVNKATKVPFLDEGRDCSGWDCWGLILAAYSELFGISLPQGEGHSYKDAQAALQALNGGARAYPEVQLGAERPGDVILFRPCHAGIVTRRGWMLNAREGRGTLVERYDNLIWKSHLIGIYRHDQPVPANI